MRLLIPTIALLAVTSLSARAETDTAIPHYDCFSEASRYYQIDIRLLLAIASVESNFDMAAVNENTNGSQDFGVMMINSSWQPRLGEMGIPWAAVQSSACMNIHVGAWVLASNFSEVGISWYAVGAYNAGFGRSDRTRRNRLRYAAKVHGHLKRIDDRFPELTAAVGSNTTAVMATASN